MKEIIEKLKTNTERSIMHTTLLVEDGKKIVAAFDKLTRLIDLYQKQVDDIDKEIFHNLELSERETCDMSAVRLKLQSVIFELKQVVG